MNKFCLIVIATFLALSPLVQQPMAHANERFSVSVKASKSTVEPTQLFIYTVTVRNTGSDDAKNPILTLSLDEDAEFESASNGGRRRRDSVEWKDFSLNAGASRTFNASVRVEKSAQDGDDLFATAFIGNAFDEVRVRVEDKDDENNDNERAVFVELFSNKPQVEPTEPFSFIVNVRNNGARKVTNTEVTVELADGIEFLSAANKGKASGNKIIWKDIDLEAHESRTLTASVRVSKDIAHLSSLTSVAYSEGSVYEHKIHVFDPNDGNERMEVHAFTNNDSVEAGESIEYTLRVKNLADHDEHIDIRGTFDPKTVFSSASDGGVQYDKTAVQWDDIVFKQSQTKSFTLTVKAKEDLTDAQTIRFLAQAGKGRAEVLSTVTPKAMESDVVAEANQTILMKESSPLRIQQTADKTEAQPGSHIRYSVSLQNTGTKTLSGLEIIEQFPQGQVSIVHTDGGNAIQNGIMWTLDHLRPDETWTKTYTVNVVRALEHGSVIPRQLSVTSNGTLVARAGEGTGVIRQLPQAGFGTFSVALRESHRFLTLKKAYANEASVPSLRTNTNKASGRMFLWSLIVVFGAATGMLIGRRFFQ